MKKSVWIILFALLAFAALPALAVTDGELLSVEIVESAMPDALPAAGISGVVVGNAAEPTGEERTSSEWPELDAVKALSADSIEQIDCLYRGRRTANCHHGQNRRFGRSCALLCAFARR